MVAPVACELHLEEFAQLLLSIGIEDFAHQVEPSLDVLRQHRNAAVGEVLRPDAEHLPNLTLHGVE